MKMPPRAIKCLEIIDKLENYIGYYWNGNEEFQKLKQVDIRFLKDYIKELSESKKISNIKLAAKIKKEMGNDDNT